MQSGVRRKATVAAGLALAAVVATFGATTASGQSQGQTRTLVVDRSFEIRTSDPQRAFEPTASIVNRGVYDTLLTFRGGNATKPRLLLARGYRASNGGRVYTFDLQARHPVRRRDPHDGGGRGLLASGVSSTSRAIRRSCSRA